VQENISIRFRERIHALRKQRGWTQEQAAEKCGIGQKLFQLYELGIKKNPGLLTLEKIAAGFSIEVYKLLAPSVPRIRAKTPLISKCKATRIRKQ
jgi:transcriptional regulator with XRE-family HTH domain